MDTAIQISPLLVANRGEIARRIIRAARELGIQTVAVFSDADRDAAHTREADAAVHLGPSAPGESYLHHDRLLAAAQRSGARAIHPGYGFVAEDAVFARACAQAGLVFVGPPATAITAMGNKSAAKDRMLAAGVPCVPGFHVANASDAEIMRAAAEVGFPLLVKAAAGGGGRGMRRVHELGQLADALVSARREAAGFGSPEVLLEKLVEGARHVEMQILADSHGRVVHTGERDCSLQRRHQKVIEEAPCPVMSPDLRRAMGDAACRAAALVDYVGAGTVEFLLDDEGQFYFLEMNTRLQVEHPVTEAVWGLDLVHWQLRIARGEALPVDLARSGPAGHAIEARLYAEDPYDQFRPQTGTLVAYEPPAGVGIRVDDGVRSGDCVTSFYDPMLAKLVASGPDRETARLRLAAALRRTAVLGLRTNRAWLINLLEHPVLVAGEVRTDSLDGGLSELQNATSDPSAADGAAALAIWLSSHLHDAYGEERGGRAAERPRRVLAQVLSLRGASGSGGAGALDGGARAAPAAAANSWTIWFDSEPHVAHEVRIAQTPSSASVWGRVEVDGLQRSAAWIASQGPAGPTVWFQLDAFEGCVAPRTIATLANVEDGSDGTIRAPASGRVVAVHVSAGQRVQQGDPLVAMEAMKMETLISSPLAGVVESLGCAADLHVDRGAVLARILPDSPPPPGSTPPNKRETA